MDDRSQVEETSLCEVAAAAEAMLVIESAPLPLAVVLPTGRIALTNKAFAEFLGYQPAELSGADIRQILADTSDFDVRWDRVVSAVGVTGDRVGRFRRRDGGHVRARIASLVINGDDGEPRFILARALSTRLEKVG